MIFSLFDYGKFMYANRIAPNGTIMFANVPLKS